MMVCRQVFGRIGPAHQGLDPWGRAGRNGYTVWIRFLVILLESQATLSPSQGLLDAIGRS